MTTTVLKGLYQNLSFTEKANFLKRVFMFITSFRIYFEFKETPRTYQLKVYTLKKTLNKSDLEEVQNILKPLTNEN